MTFCYQAKDFIQTKEGLVFAVVEPGLEKGKVLCFLRYMRQGVSWQKLATHQANELLGKHYPKYTLFSTVRSAHLHAVAVADIDVHYQPKKRLISLLNKQNPDNFEQDFINLVQLFMTHGIQTQYLGVTGSLLIGAQNIHSDIDLVVYGRQGFHQLRAIVKKLQAKDKLQRLTEDDWLDSYKRRQCDLNYNEYVWHEQRKYNKALINSRKFDLNLIEQATEYQVDVKYEKQGKIILRAFVMDAQYSFDYPARFLIEHEKVSEVICYTATYTGQAEDGEIIEISGQLETSSKGLVRILVGSTREAKGEYIKVVANL